MKIKEHESSHRFFDKSASRYKERAWLGTRVRRFDYKRTKEQLLKTLAPKKNERVLEVGCGPGVWTELIAPRCGRMLSIDISDEMIKQAKRNVKGRTVEFVNADFAHYGPKGKFDKIYFVRVFEYFRNKKKIIKKIHQLLKPEGKLVIITKTKPSAWGLSRYLLKLWRKAKGEDRTYAWTENISPWRMKKIFKNAGFRNIRVKPLNLRKPIFKGGEQGDLSIVGKTFEGSFLKCADLANRFSDSLPESLSFLLMPFSEAYIITGEK